MLKLTQTGNRVHLTPELRKMIADWVVCTLQDKCNTKKFFQETQDALHEKSDWFDPIEDARSGAWGSMAWNIQLTDDGDETELLKAFRYLMNAIEIELCEASKKMLYSAYEENVLPNTEAFDV